MLCFHRPDLVVNFEDLVLNEVKVVLVVFDDLPVLSIVLLVALEFLYPLVHFFELVLRLLPRGAPCHFCLGIRLFEDFSVLKVLP